MSWQGEQKRLNTCSPAVASCANVVPVEAARAIPAITHVLIIFSFSRQVPAPGPPMPADPRSDESANGIGRPTAIPLVRMASNGLQVNRPRGQFVSPQRSQAYLAEWVRSCRVAAINSA